MNVDYVDHLGTDLTVVNSARVSFAKHHSEFEDSDTKLLKYLAKHNHWSPFAHPQIQLRVKAPVFVARQLQKHVVGLVWNEISRRYVDDPPEFYVPEHWRGRPTNGAKQGSSDTFVTELVPVNLFGDNRVSWQYDNFLEIASGLYDRMLESGIAPEQARMVLPQSMYTSWYWTGSLASYARVCRQRLDPHAQGETQEIARMISDIIEPLFPESWRLLLD